MANALATSSSPYLLQHAEHPVDWVPWSQDALERASRVDKPLLISIGYSACHWCQAMAHESFENAEVAAVMNEHFVCIKVDREERPDLDAIYLDACQALTGQSGWPLHVFATPDGRPFYAGTYFPPQPTEHLPGWQQVIEALGTAWTEQRHEIEETGTRLAATLSGAAQLAPAVAVPDAPFLDQATTAIAKRFDSVHGGFGGAPKFPPSTALAFLLARDQLPMVRYTLASMASGGIFDQVGGGFFRYAVDPAWSEPHFEKLLADNALLATRYAEAASVTGDPAFGRVAERTLDWIVRDLSCEDGGFASALAADSGSTEGAFYTWTPQQLRDALTSDDATTAMAWFGVADAGSREGDSTVLEERGAAPEPQARDRILDALLVAREGRARPARDDKRIVSWNALTISALVAGSERLGRGDQLAAAERCAALILETAQDHRGRLLRLIPRDTDDHSQIPAGVLEDHAHLLDALVALYEATTNERWLQAATQLAAVLLRDFVDPDRGGFFSTANDHE
ncbi:MAG: thioredoxin domain-containing protein, partial [Solirubrobacteraceae bacterium]|nr:thioredoxin domain-containing protein [Solirubrobacteraceae bacterium]